MLKEVCYITTHVSIFPMIVLSFRLKRSICQKHCAYFTTLVVTIHYEKRSVFDSRKYEGYVYLRKVLVALLL